MFVHWARLADVYSSMFRSCFHSAAYWGWTLTIITYASDHIYSKMIHVFLELTIIWTNFQWWEVCWHPKRSDPGFDTKAVFSLAPYIQFTIKVHKWNNSRVSPGSVGHIFSIRTITGQFCDHWWVLCMNILVQRIFQSDFREMTMQDVAESTSELGNSQSASNCFHGQIGEAGTTGYFCIFFPTSVFP